MKLFFTLLLMQDSSQHEPSFLLHQFKIQTSYHSVICFKEIAFAQAIKALTETVPLLKEQVQHKRFQGSAFRPTARAFEI